ncbi:MAG: RNA methyltransferase [Treponema sp.]|jgi:tRNA/rRNA methyltransferase/tRNA (cytidine32/uridine32-2'-O)-methyltransferase|nr:RNA methyltransferase [Treponema sp.]
MILGNVKIVLSRSSEPGNMGAICRVMKNMGFSGLRLADPKIAKNSPADINIIQTRAVHAFDIWENAQVFDTLAEAVKDCSIVVGTTRRRGQYRKNISMPPRALAEWLAGQKDANAAIVFGNERTGLEDAELELCNFASHIPVSEGQPSLNLSHAVQIYAYELFLALQEQKPVKGEWQPMNQAEITALVADITDTLANLGFYKLYGRDIQERFLHDLAARAGISEKEGKYFKDIFVKAARLGSNSMI